MNSLVVEDLPFHAVLKYDKVLIGIILGFGAENSLYGSRLENILESSEGENPPFLPTHTIKLEDGQAYLPFPPSFGFKSIQEESDSFWKKLAVSSPSLKEKKPNFIFGWDKGEIKNKKLISNLEEAQKKIQSLIKMDHFEATVIRRITGENEYLKSYDPEAPSTESIGLKYEKTEANNAIAKGLWEWLQRYPADYLPYFIEGMENPDAKGLVVERSAPSPHHYSDFIEAKGNLKAADTYFQSIHNSDNFQCIVPLKLYYKTIQAGEGQQACNGSLVTLTYSISSPLGHHLNGGSDKLINLKNTIPGFAHGIKGMTVGETRELFIHPCLAYGFNTSSLDKCIYLKAVVTLEGVHDEVPLTKIDDQYVDCLPDPEAIKACQINVKNELMAKGAEISSHLKKCKEIDLCQVKDRLIQFSCDKAPCTPTTEAEQAIINRVHWNIYRSSARD